MYDYCGDGTRWKRSVDGTVTNVYYWDENYTVVNEEIGVRGFMHVGRTLAYRDFDAGAQTTTWIYYYGDQLGSTRRLRDSAKNSMAQFEFDPYGLFYAQSETINATTHLYAGLDYDSVAAFHFAPYRICALQDLQSSLGPMVLS